MSLLQLRWRHMEMHWSGATGKGGGSSGSLACSAGAAGGVPTGAARDTAARLAVAEAPAVAGVWYMGLRCKAARIHSGRQSMIVE